MGTTNTARYAGKPMLRLLEFYTLRAIGCLEKKEEEVLHAMTPNLRSALKAEGEWYDVIEKAMKLPPTMPANIRELWEKNKTIAEGRGMALSPQLFAEMFVDANLT